MKLDPDAGASSDQCEMAGLDQVAQSERPERRPGEGVIPELYDGIRDPSVVGGHGVDDPEQDVGVLSFR